MRKSNFSKNPKIIKERTEINITLDGYGKLCYIFLTSYRGVLFCCPKIEGDFNDYGQILMEVLSMRTKVTLACTECKQRNYDTMKNKKNTPDRIEMNKYCRFCKKHTLHRETK